MVNWSINAEIERGANSTMEEDIKAIEMLGKLELRNPALVRNYFAHRIAKSGLDQLVTIKIFDNGPSNPDSRFTCLVESDDGKKASGNSANAIEAALAIVHWHKLD